MLHMRLSVYTTPNGNVVSIYSLFYGSRLQTFVINVFRTSSSWRARPRAELSTPLHAVLLCDLIVLSHNCYTCNRPTLYTYICRKWLYKYADCLTTAVHCTVLSDVLYFTTLTHFRLIFINTVSLVVSDTVLNPLLNSVSIPYTWWSPTTGNCTLALFFNSLNRVVIFDKYVLQFRTSKIKTLWPLVRKRTIPTERPPLVGEI
jgi:hypothetical protein